MWISITEYLEKGQTAGGVVCGIQVYLSTGFRILHTISSKNNRPPLYSPNYQVIGLGLNLRMLTELQPEFPGCVVAGLIILVIALPIWTCGLRGHVFCQPELAAFDDTE